ncbi:fumarate hydratase subunit alpha [Natranaerovirga hydrolytica]|uniref:Fumarate hydratase subunit alpha n=1 Tax=Natranaerovirga hydrolytica TaxID=680378 RepID=A0A4V2PYP3_9FIRM|nr:fumarate hydratase [Natranaerovirga hydrolytica]TCK86801.1 fumarate hydratase subunit alpha [Natranaerovirga hydrolytica]
MRKINSSQITENVKEMCIEANYYLSEDIEEGIKASFKKEKSPIGRQIIGQLEENMTIAKEKKIPICQDTGMVVIFVEIGQEVLIEGDLIDDAIQEGVRKGYTEGYLRKSIVKDPLIRENTKDNTPAIIHYNMVKGDQIKLTVAPKGFGSENTSKLAMLKPSDGIDEIKTFIINTVDELGANACPPLVIGVGIGGNFEKVAYMAKKSLLRPINESSKLPHIKELEDELLIKINALGVGPQGLGGTTTALGVNIETFPTHIAGLPVAVNICCHVNRHITREI